jgi:D-3-phosphoglycerate dehydrogenase / 2-oxoglutarate reductase
MTWKILVTAPPILPKVDLYRDLFAENNAELLTPDFHVVECLNAAELKAHLVDVDAILCGDDELNEDVIRSANKLKVISKWGTGIDSIDTVAAKACDIEVCRVVDVFADPLADTVMAYILSYCRKINEKNALVRAGDWVKTESYTPREKAIGVVGVGHVGSTVVQRAHAFGMKVYVYDRRGADASMEAKYHCESVSFDTLLSNSDFISINCDLNETSRHLFSKAAFAKMKSSAMIINTARGAIINEKHLCDALINEEIAAAALDVFEIEPLPSDSPLRQLDNVMLSPHNSNGSPAVFNRVDQIAISNIFNYLNKTSIAFSETPAETLQEETN